ncbi:MAG: energy-coupling factor transporter transmembrane protein EcfT [Oscillospiraceae bacterium]|jgi:energy-coupling factor transport system permease protein|nr:energy-coupling factor transporter transmembrane protein EcfT [Oscillospiraceae bacterium]
MLKYASIKAKKGGARLSHRDAFSGYHPLVGFLYFALVMAFAAVFISPVCLASSLVCALAYSIYLNGARAIRFNLLYMLPMLIFAALINPAFNHEGATILTYLPSGNPLTLESIIYGIVAAAILVTMITWFSCFSAVMTSDKFVYLFGRVIPALSLVLSMSLRFAPRFKAQLKIISNAQKCVGRDVSNGSLLKKARHGVRILSIMVTWALENAIETADSMKSRGYGLPGRTAFSIYRFDRRDALALAFVVLAGAAVIAGGSMGAYYFRYFPTVRGAAFSPVSLSMQLVYFALGALPVFLNVKEDRKWKAIASKT